MKTGRGGSIETQVPPGCDFDTLSRRGSIQAETFHTSGLALGSEEEMEGCRGGCAFSLEPTCSSLSP